MRMLTRSGICLAAITAVLTPVATLRLATAAADNGTTIPLTAKLRHCDFSVVSVSPQLPYLAHGSGSTIIHRSGSTVVADVHLVEGSEPGTHFDVGLIQEPRPSSATCGPGDPGTAFVGLDTDGAGAGSTTVQGNLAPGATGVWVMITRPNPRSQNPAEYYSSDYVAPV